MAKRCPKGKTYRGGKCITSSKGYSRSSSLWDAKSALKLTGLSLVSMILVLILMSVIPLPTFFANSSYFPFLTSLIILMSLAYYFGILKGSRQIVIFSIALIIFNTIVPAVLSAIADEGDEFLFPASDPATIIWSVILIVLVSLFLNFLVNLVAFRLSIER